MKTFKFNKYACLLLTICCIASCGGSSSSGSDSVFHGTYTGILQKADCNPAWEGPDSISTRHKVISKSDESGSDIALIDLDTKAKYEGEVILTANSVAQIWGFVVFPTGTDDKANSNQIAYDIANVAEGEAEVDVILLEGKDSCRYSGVLDKQ